MKTRTLFPAVVVLFAASLFVSHAQPQTKTAILELQASSNGLGNWQTIQISTNTVAAANAFFRMRITLATQPTTNNMVSVQGGTLPAPSELAGIAVTTFQIGKYEVTSDEWREVAEWAVTNGYSDFVGVGEGSTSIHPVQSVNWNDVVKWCNARSEKEGLQPVYLVDGKIHRTGETLPTLSSTANGYRLPNEAEWEWAARGGVNSQGFTYSGSNDVNAVARYFENSSGADVWLSPEGRGTWPVGSRAANELGIHDMSGNVWEWFWGFDVPTGSWRRIRGGSWIGNALYCSVADRGEVLATIDRVNYVGFRVARNAP